MLIRDCVHSGWCLFGIVSIRDCVHSGLCPFGMVPIRDCVHSGLCPFGMVSIRDGSGSCTGSEILNSFAVEPRLRLRHLRLAVYPPISNRFTVVFVSLSFFFRLNYLSTYHPLFYFLIFFNFNFLSFK